MHPGGDPPPRTGLAETATLDGLRRAGGAVYDVELDGPAPSLAGVPGLQDVVPVAGGVRITVDGPPGPLLAELARWPVTSLRSRDADLEDVFRSYYTDAAPL